MRQGELPRSMVTATHVSRVKGRLRRSALASDDTIFGLEACSPLGAANPVSMKQTVLLPRPVSTRRCQNLSWAGASRGQSRSENVGLAEVQLTRSVTGLQPSRACLPLQLEPIMFRRDSRAC